MEWPVILGRLGAGDDLTRDEARQAMEVIMGGDASAAQIAAFVVALRMKGETVDEMTGLVEAMRAASLRVDVGDPVVDTAGTGGDRLGTFNISTTAALVAAGAGARVAKHGNRSASSRCGSADVLEALGVVIDLAPGAAVDLLGATGFTFFFAPLYHPAMRYAAGVRRELGIPTVFNFLGPLSNPAGATRQAIGVSDPAMAERMIGVLARLGAEYAFVYYGEDGLDEVTVTGPTYIYRLRAGEITHAEFTPEDFGVDRWPLEALGGGDAGDNAEIVRRVLAGEQGAIRDATLVNAAPALVAAGLATGFVEGVELAVRSIDSGAAAGVLEAVIDGSRARAGA